MIDSPNMLLLARDEMADELLAGFGSDCTLRENAYDALLAMSQRPWPAIIITAPRDDLAGICRAARRLQKEAKVLALCPPSAEADVRVLGELIDDYFIYPPTGGDLQHIRALAAPPQVKPAANIVAGSLSPQATAELVSAARAVAPLEAAVARMVCQIVGGEVVWTDGGRLTDASAALLRSNVAPQRVLMLAQPRELSPATAATLAGLQEILPALFETAQRAESLHRLAVTDHLTGAYNRRYFYHLSDQILSRARQRDLRVTLLLWDIDDFKRYNDTYGHAAGDEILRETAALMKKICRTHDVVARIGGDEFAALFWDISGPRSPSSKPLQTAYQLSDRFRRAVNRHELSSLGPEARGVLTISGGLAMFPDHGQTCRDLLKKADEGLRAAKEAGKNVIIAGKR